MRCVHPVAGLTTTLFCRGNKIEEKEGEIKASAATILSMANVDMADKADFAKESYRNLVTQLNNLVTEKNLLLAERRELQKIAGGQLPCLALTPTPLCCWLISMTHNLA